MSLSDMNRKILFSELHEIMAQSADDQISNIKEEKWENMVYPPSIELLIEEKNALKNLIKSGAGKSALRKVLRDTSAASLFHFFNLVDGTGDPRSDSADWSGVKLVDYYEDNEQELFLHDELFNTYWDWQGNAGED